MLNRLNEVLPLVTKPIRYIGGEYNTYYSGSQEEKVKWVLAMPEIYEIGMSNYGLRLLYSILNRLPGVVCERCYVPWPDFGNALKSNGLPLYALESKRPVREFDIVGISLQTELSYTNLLYLLDLSGIPRYRTERNHTHPLVIAGGPCTVNPLPVVNFVDVFVIGDGEEVVQEISRIFADTDRKNRDLLLQQIAQLTGVFVPDYTDIKNKPVVRRLTTELLDDYFPFPPVVPICEIVHDRLTVEIARGCVHGCRFCQAGMTNRPLRFRSVEQIVRLAERGIRASGWEEVSLLALSALDYPYLLELIHRLNSILAKRRVAISLPSTRGEDFTPELALNLQEVKKAGLTFAPETASSRLRALINKNISEAKIIESVKNALDAGWGGVKLYFMIGLPGETEQDVREIARFVNEVARLCKNRTVRFNLTPFIPKPHTPLQWAGFADPAETNQKISLLKNLLQRRNIKCKWEKPERSYIQALLARGDEKLGPVIEQVYQSGGIFQEWTDFFNFSLWQEALNLLGLDPADYLKELPVDSRLPWDFIQVGVNRDFLLQEYQKAQAGKETPNCLTAGCSNCGACLDKKIAVPPKPRIGSEEKKNRHERRWGLFNELKSRLRLKYVIEEPFRFAGHLDRVRAFYRALRRSELPIIWTKGYAPKPMLSFGPPLPVGVLSDGEYLDLFLDFRYSGNIVRDLSPFLPKGLRIIAAQTVPINGPSLGEIINVGRYEFITNSTDQPPVNTGIPGLIGITQLSDHRYLIDLTIAPGIKLLRTLSQLLSIPEDQARQLWIKRKNCLVFANGTLKSPLGETIAPLSAEKDPVRRDLES